MAPAIITKKNIKVVNFFKKMGANIGLLFQITDDLIDYNGSSMKAGKKTRKDKKKGKATLISLLGLENAIKLNNEIKFKITNNLSKYGSKSKNIKETLNFILTRNK